MFTHTTSFHLKGHILTEMYTYIGALKLPRNLLQPAFVFTAILSWNNLHGYSMFIARISKFDKLALFQFTHNKKVFNVVASLVKYGESLVLAMMQLQRSCNSLSG